MALSADNLSLEIKNDPLSIALWYACAGPLVTLPEICEPVYYFPEGHLEQLQASIGQIPELMLPALNLPSKSLCRVDDLSLMAEPETDEVFSKFSLLPLPDRADTIFQDVPVSEKGTFDSFCKTLTESDTNLLGGFSVPQKHAEKCLPVLDISKDEPSQILVAADLHNKEWQFKHVYEGQPKRHLLTTGWNAFVNSQKLLPGDAFICLKGGNEVLRVGVRRVMRQEVNTSCALISPQGMLFGLLSSTAKSLADKTRFSVTYKPRTMTPNFVVSLNKYIEAKNRKWSLGMRFKMGFEGEDALVNWFSGTVVGVGANDSLVWPKSDWRSLRVEWDEPSAIKPDKVSPWEIEPLVANDDIPPLQSQPPQWMKLPRAPHMPSPTTGLRRFFAENPSDGHGEKSSFIGGPSSCVHDGAGPSTSTEKKPTGGDACKPAEERLKEVMKKLRGKK